MNRNNLPGCLLAPPGGIAIHHVCRFVRWCVRSLIGAEYAEKRLEIEARSQ